MPTRGLWCMLYMGAYITSATPSPMAEEWCMSPPQAAYCHCSMCSWCESCEKPPRWSYPCRFWAHGSVSPPWHNNSDAHLGERTILHLYVSFV
ncbi:hypothetical protein BDV95DRAFT_343598 [Massariosphaeria phaeospora]|uniref:Secreted protein n=1 Tax=Massariosphaeria phaeospora TaxID=100035 RepID=A0A7C8IDC5_9PLEO|nr:hypothetical protein BDV95DRAFT_343598 [Massariosphaeria phaeospora]